MVIEVLMGRDAGLCRSGPYTTCLSTPQGIIQTIGCLDGEYGTLRQALMVPSSGWTTKQFMSAGRISVRDYGICMRRLASQTPSTESGYGPQIDRNGKLPTWQPFARRVIRLAYMIPWGPLPQSIS